MTPRVLAFVVAVVAHIAVLMLLTGHRAVRHPPTDDSRMVLVFIAQDAVQEPREPARQTPASSSVLPRKTGAASLPSPIDSRSPPVDPAVDWSRESELAARRQVDALEAARQRDRGFTPVERESKRGASPAPVPEFGWDRSSTHRIEPQATGGTIIHINDRCFIVISGLIMPMCRLGKIEARGDLFKHMRDVPQLGETKREGSP